MIINPKDKDYAWLLRLDSDGCFEPGCNTGEELQFVKVSSIYAVDTGLVVLPIGTDQRFIVIPNPGTDELTAILPQPIQDIRWRLLDDLGRTIRKGKKMGIQERLELQIEGVISGMYFLEIRNKFGDVRMVEKVVLNN